MDAHGFRAIVQRGGPDDNSGQCLGRAGAATARPLRLMLAAEGEAEPWRDQLFDLVRCHQSLRSRTFFRR